MSRAASFAERWARGNLYRPASEEELRILSLFLCTCNGDEVEATKRARRYYKARGPGGLRDLWHQRHPDGEDILSSCQDALASEEELKVLSLFLCTCNGDEVEATKRARRYYKARGPGGLRDLWHQRHPDGEDILSSCQDAYIVPLRARSVSGRRLTLIRLPAPTAMDKPLNVKALLSRWLMIMDIRLREDPTPGDEMVFIDVSDMQPSHVKSHFKGTYWKNFASCIKNAYPLQFSEVHVINTQRLKILSLLMLHIGLYPWRRSNIKLHSNAEKVNIAMGVDYFPIEGLPFEYGGKCGFMKDLNDEWTKKVLSNSKWLQSEERKFYDTELKATTNSRTRHKSSVRLGTSNASYDMTTRTHSCSSLYRPDDFDEGTYGAYRTLKVKADSEFCV